MTLASLRQPTGRAIPIFVGTAMSMALGATAWADSGDGIASLTILIGLACPLVTAIVAFRRNALTSGVLLLVLLVWPIALIYVLTKRDQGEGEDLGIGKPKRDRLAAPDDGPPATNRAAT